MLKERIFATLRFFDLQDYPLTLLELHKFLIANMDELKNSLDEQGEIKQEPVVAETSVQAGIDEILECLDSINMGEVENVLGFYCLPGRKAIVDLRLNNYFYGIEREKLIKKYIGALNYLPFVRGVALAGSQAMGQQKEFSDIDLLIITDPGFLWLARTLATAYFQLIGKRRYGKKIANRFCLNHYLAGPKRISQLRNLYTAAEYLKLRPLVYPHSIWSFQAGNSPWLKAFFPNYGMLQPLKDRPYKLQRWLESLLDGKFGLWLEKKLKNWQLPKIRREKFIVVEADELSFHPGSKQKDLLADFLKLQEQQ